MKRRTLLAAATAAPFARVHAADVLRIVVAYPPVGVSDQVARLLAEHLAPLVGSPVVVDHRPGAGGGVALSQLSLSRADGRTLAFAAISPLALSPHFGTPAPHVVPVSGVMPAARKASAREGLEVSAIRRARRPEPSSRAARRPTSPHPTINTRSRRKRAGKAPRKLIGRGFLRQCAVAVAGHAARAAPL